MVLVMESDGLLTATQSQNSFARNYNDGVGQGTAADALAILDAPDDIAATEETRIAAIAPRAPLPRADVLSAIEATALRYGSHSGLRRAGLSVSDWLTLFRASIEIESAYRQSAVSSAGAIGLGQLMPATARDLGVDPRDPLQNLDGSARYLAMMLELFGDPRLALAAYNAGPDAVRQYGGPDAVRQYGGIPPYRETQNHVARVMAVVARLEGTNP
jgi:membrane-bound lytic murein transglycosylase MltF